MIWARCFDGQRSCAARSGGSGDTVLATSATEVPSGGSARPIAIFLGLEDLGAIGEDLTALGLLYSAGVYVIYAMRPDQGFWK